MTITDAENDGCEALAGNAVFGPRGRLTTDDYPELVEQYRIEQG